MIECVYCNSMKMCSTVFHLLDQLRIILRMFFVYEKTIGYSVCQSSGFMLRISVGDQLNQKQKMHCVICTFPHTQTAVQYRNCQLVTFVLHFGAPFIAAPLSVAPGDMHCKLQDCKYYSVQDLFRLNTPLKKPIKKESYSS